MPIYITPFSSPLNIRQPFTFSCLCPYPVWLCSFIKSLTFARFRTWTPGGLLAGTPSSTPTPTLRLWFWSWAPRSHRRRRLGHRHWQSRPSARKIPLGCDVIQMTHRSGPDHLSLVPRPRGLGTRLSPPSLFSIPHSSMYHAYWWLRLKRLVCPRKSTPTCTRAMWCTLHNSHAVKNKEGPTKQGTCN